MKQSNLSPSGLSLNQFKHMKRIFFSLTLVGFVAAGLTGLAQTTSPAGDADSTAANVTPAKDAPPMAAAPEAAPATQEPVATAAANETVPSAAAATDTPIAEASAPATEQVAATDAASPAPASSPAVAADAPPAESDAVGSASAGQPAAVIPLIVMDDVPLTDAIRNLARQAGLNYMLDPKIGYGQLGPDGKPAAQPNVSIRWENVTAEQALNALLNNYSLQMVEDPKSKIARVTIKDPAAPPPLLTKIIQLKYAGPSNVVASVQASFTDKRSKVMPDTRTSQLVVIATEKELADVDELVQRLDTRTKQVLIEARILETTVNPKTTKGVDWTGTLAKQHVTMGNNALAGTPPTPATPAYVDPNTGNLVPAVPASAGTIGGILSSPQLLMNAASGSFFNPAQAFLNADGVSAIISFLNTYSEVREISAPRSVTLDNEKAVVEVGTLYPIVNVTAGTSQTTGGSQITYSNLTIRLEVTPRISANDYVNLTVNPSITKLGPQYTSKIAGQDNTVDSFLTRNLVTHVMIPSGNTLVMGGLIQDQINSGSTKVPLLGDIPVLGYLFRQDSKDRSKTDLILFITPTIVQDEDYQPTTADFLHRPVPKKDSLEGDWSAWDSGKPKDWSKKPAAPEYQDSDTMAK